MSKNANTFDKLKAIRGPLNPGPARRVFTDEERRLALRTAFIARFIVLREGRRSRAHRMIEEMVWTNDATAEDVANMFRQAFIANGDKIKPVDKDIQKALKHARRSAEYFVDQYIGRATSSFREALTDYMRSNALLFSEEDGDRPRDGGWRAEE